MLLLCLLDWPRIPFSNYGALVNESCYMHFNNIKRSLFNGIDIAKKLGKALGNTEHPGKEVFDIVLLLAVSDSTNKDDSIGRLERLRRSYRTFIPPKRRLVPGDLYLWSGEYVWAYRKKTCKHPNSIPPKYKAIEMEPGQICLFMGYEEQECITDPLYHKAKMMVGENILIVGVTSSSSSCKHLYPDDLLEPFIVTSSHDDIDIHHAA